MSLVSGLSFIFVIIIIVANILVMVPLKRDNLVIRAMWHKNPELNSQLSIGFHKVVYGK